MPQDAPETPATPDPLTWAVLLGRWVDFARSAVALPGDEAGRAMRDTVPDAIMLQAVWFALQDLDELPADQRALGLDRAGVLIDQHAEAIRQRWDGLELPAMLGELIDDARAQLTAVSRSKASGASGSSGSAGGTGASSEPDQS